MIFEDKHEPIELTIKNNQGKEYLLETQFMSANDIKDVELKAKEPEVEGTTLIYLQLEKLFHKKENFFKQFSLDVLKQVIEYVSKEKSKGLKKNNG